MKNNDPFNFVKMISVLTSVSVRMALEPVPQALNTRESKVEKEIQWGDYIIGWYVNKKGKMTYRFNHPMSEETNFENNSQNARSGWHTFEKPSQCLQSLVQHRTCHMVKSIIGHYEDCE